MSEQVQDTSAEYVANYLGRVLAARTTGAEPLDGQPIRTRGAGHIGPELWADAPWRLEPGEREIPFTFIVRDAQGPNVGMELDEIAIYEAPDDAKPWDEKDWRLVHCFGEGLGPIARRYWTYRPTPSVPLGPPPTVPLSRFQTAALGQPLLLKVQFKGSRLRPGQGRRPFRMHKYLCVFPAAEPLPLRDSPQWYYGDTHYHSSYTNDVKEFGNPVPDTRVAAECIGLDWLAITDHSVDLADENPYHEDAQAGTRWDNLGLEVRQNSDERFRLLRGEEVTVLGAPGKGNDTLHVLVLGTDFQRLIPGAFAKESLLTGAICRLVGFAQETYAHLFGPVYKLEEVLTGVDRNGKAVAALKGRSVQAQGALAFAAHPASMAQSPGGTWEFYDLVQPIHGVEAWNGGLRRCTGEQACPFDYWQAAGDWAKGASKQGIDAWDQILRHKVGQADPRFVLLAGSDAHGSFNYSEGWWVDWDGFRADDSALGKVRTLIYLPQRDPAGQRRAPGEVEVVEALRTGSCVVTDGPVLNATVSFSGTRAMLGQILTVDGDGTLEVDVQAASSVEFGQVKQFQVLYYFRGMDETAAVPLEYAVGNATLVDDDLPAGPGYVRLAAETHHGRDTYRCFTNPIWIKSVAPGRRQSRVTCIGW